MSDLISRKAVKDGIREYFTKQISSKEAPWNILAHSAELQRMVDNLPVAYDVEAVIRKISNYGIEKIHKSILPTTISAVSDVARKNMMIVADEFMDRGVDDDK